MKQIMKIKNITIQVIIILSIVTFSISTIPDLTAKQLHILKVVEWVTVIIFTVEYIGNALFVEPKGLKYILSFGGVIDLMSVLPFYITGIDLRVVRVIRLLKLFKIPRFQQGLDKFAHVIRDTKDEFILFFSIAGLLLFISSVGIYFFEGEAQPEAFGSVFRSLWWSVVTLTTVGYGDVYPITIGGKIFTAIILLIGLGIVAIPIGLITSSFSKLKDR